MPVLETTTAFPLTITNGTLATQIKFTYATDFLQRYQQALTTVAEYISNQESSGDTNYADKIIFARMLLANPAYWANQLATAIANDPATINLTCTDQNICDRIWTILPGVYRQASTVRYSNTLGA